MADELEEFIREQKSKLTQDRLGNNVRSSPEVNSRAHQKYLPSSDSPKSPRSHNVSTEGQSGSQQTGIIGRMGAYEKRRLKLQEERKLEYNQMIQNKNQRGTRKVITSKGDYAISQPSPTTLKSSSTKSLTKKESGDFYASLPLCNHPSVQQRKEDQRNLEYNTIVKRATPHAWQNSGTPVQPPTARSESADNARDIDIDEVLRRRDDRVPRQRYDDSDARNLSYEETLDAKRFQEYKYRKDNTDIIPELRNASSENNIYQHTQAKNSDQYIPTPDRKKVRFDNVDQDSDFSQWVHQQKVQNQTPPLASLQIGNEATSIEKARRQEIYRQELTQQIKNKGASSPGYGPSVHTSPLHQTRSRSSASPAPPMDSRHSRTPMAAPPISAPNVNHVPHLDISDEQTPRRHDNAITPKKVDPATHEFANIGRSQKKEKQMSYQSELLKQIEEQKSKKMKEKAELALYEKKIEDQCISYNSPSGGGGAPVIDKHGNKITNRLQAAAASSSTAAQVPGHLQNDANLRNICYEVQHKDEIPTYFAPEMKLTLPNSVDEDNNQFNLAESSGNTAVVSPSALAKDSSYSRGSNLMNLHGETMTVAQKSNQQKYQDDLKIQIEEKNRIKELQKKKEKQEDEKLMHKIIEENRLMKIQVEHEKVVEAEKLEQKRLDLEKKKQDANDRKIAHEKATKLAEEKFAKEKEERQRSERETQVKLEQARGKSPPLPAHCKRNKTPNSERPISSYKPPESSRDTEKPTNGLETPISSQAQTRRTSKTPVSKAPVARSPVDRDPKHNADLLRPDSADVLTKLADMRKHLQMERKRVENNLGRNSPNVFDTRNKSQNISQYVPSSKHEIFNDHSILNQKISSIQPDANILEFNQLRGNGDSLSRNGLRETFPNDPRSDDTLDAQQRALLQQQTEKLTRLAKSKRKSDIPQITREPSTISANILDSSSAFISVDKSRESTRSSRRNEPNYERAVSNLGSVKSLDPEALNAKNSERLRLLRISSNIDADSINADDVVNDFMTMQTHRRPPSAKTLDDDSWQRPNSSYRGSRV